jgi:hypothetical protein
MTASNLVAQSINERYGAVCDVFDPECDTCRAWKWFRDVQETKALVAIILEAGKSNGTKERVLELARAALKETT